MKYLLITLLFAHGMIHLFGFAKAFKLIRIELTETDISVVHGILWFIAFILFSLAGEALLSKNPHWHWVAIGAIAVSTFLIAGVWKDARYGMIPNLIIGLAAVWSLFDQAFEKQVSYEISGILKKKSTAKVLAITENQVEELPYPVLKWLKKSGAAGHEKTTILWLGQRLRMKTRPDQQEWYEATAEQYVATDRPAFVWKVKMKMPPFFRLAGRDRFVDGKGEMLIKMFSVFTVVREDGDKIDEGSLQRYLAEIVWFPSAALEDYISWETIDSVSAKATIRYKGTVGSGIFYFNREGEFVEFRTFRYKDNHPDARRYEWIITAKEHTVLNGIKIPTTLEVSWVLENGKWTWLLLEVTGISHNPAVGPDMIFTEIPGH